MYRILYLGITIFIFVFHDYNVESFILGNGSCPYIPSEPLPYPTPSPINIATSKIQAVNTSTPLVIRNGLFGPLLVKNDGHALVIIGYTASPTTAGSYGGVLCDTFYKFYKGLIYFNRDLKGRSYDTIDGEGTPLTVVLIYQNSKYPNFQEALLHRDGLVIEVFRYKFSLSPNSLFVPVSGIINLLRKPGSEVYAGPDFLVYGWFDVIAFIPGYYFYLGAYTDPETGKSYDCATIVVAKGVYPLITESQFLTSFALLEGYDGKPLETKAPMVFYDEKREIYETSGVTGQYVAI